MSIMANARVHVFVSGLVQGVGYRYFVQTCAYETGVVGYVKNLPDGTVKIVAEGNREDLDAFTSMIWARENLVIRVTDLFVKPEPSTGEFASFGIRW